MLKEIYGSQYKMKDASSYIDDGQRMDKRFWIQDRWVKLLVQIYTARGRCHSMGRKWHHPQKVLAEMK